ncbi:uncharacterized protein [Rutidosis leptorrhynchoides]|uniref:uncharacterized protein n=1 Tax=Rutidosis leptorrhynchoides TaxID=125765 RepID=UPI003A99089F
MFLALDSIFNGIMRLLLEHVSQTSDREIDLTSIRFWVNWNVGLCFIWVLASVGTAIYLIAKNEKLQNQEPEEAGDNVDDGLWLICTRHSPQIVGFWGYTLQIIFQIYFCHPIMLGGVILLCHLVGGGNRWRWWLYLSSGRWDGPPPCWVQGGATLFCVCAFWGSMIFLDASTRASIDWVLFILHLAYKHSPEVTEISMVSHCIFHPLDQRLYWFPVDPSCMWPYFFLNLSSPHSPLWYAWYLLVEISHVVFFGVFFLVIWLKRRFLLKTSPNLTEAVHPFEINPNPNQDAVHPLEINHDA